MDTRDLTVLAYGIATYGAALEHLAALRRVGVRVPYVLDQRMSAEQMVLTLRWAHEHGDVLADPEEVLVEARTFLTEHGYELDELVNREREADERTRQVEHSGLEGPATAAD